MIVRRTVAIATALLLVGGGAVVAEASALEAEIAAQVTENTALVAQIDATSSRGERIDQLIAHHQGEGDGLDAVLAVRPDFLTEIAALRAALQNAEGKIETGVHLAAAHAAQDTVLAADDDAETVTNATATIRALVAKVGEEVAEWENQRVQLAGTGPLWSTSGADGYARVRAALDRVGGAGVGLYESASCAGGSAPACANSDGYIKYRSDVATWNDGRLNWAMAHELAHIHQFRVWEAMTGSATYHSLFRGDPEFLANCMAVVRGYPGSVGCDGAQQRWASAIWVGVVG